jgi:predicted RNA binding protein YcfA (HicA-like mRNA interferase family)
VITATVKYREVRRRLRDDGYAVIATAGSHEKMGASRPAEQGDGFGSG